MPASTAARESTGRKRSKGCRLADQPRWQVVVDHDAFKQLERLNRPDRDRIARAIDSLPQGDVRPLHGESGIWRLRVGDWRVRFRLDAELRRIDVLAVSSRGSAYRR